MPALDEDGDVIHFYHFAPIGCVVAWLKTLTGCPALPSAWVECGGQVLSDTESPFDGQTLPDLNGDNRVLKGASTSGTVATPTVTTYTGTNTTGGHNRHGDDVGGTAAHQTTYGDHSHTLTTSSANLEKTYTVVWIMRIK